MDRRPDRFPGGILGPPPSVSVGVPPSTPRSPRAALGPADAPHAAPEDPRRSTPATTDILRRKTDIGVLDERALAAFTEFASRTTLADSPRPL